QYPCLAYNGSDDARQLYPIQTTRKHKIERQSILYEELQLWKSDEFSPSSYRSEEHTSELQSRENLVCRLLLEKKKIRISVLQQKCVTTQVTGNARCPS